MRTHNVRIQVYDGGEAVAWCQYGSPEELPNIHHCKQYEAELDQLPDYRITCIFVDKKYRRKGVRLSRAPTGDVRWRRPRLRAAGRLP